MNRLVKTALRLSLAAVAAFGGLAAQAADRAPGETIDIRQGPSAAKSYTYGGALRLQDSAGYAFQGTGGPVTLTVTNVVNDSTTTISGSIRVGLFLTAVPYTQATTYYLVASTDLAPLAPGASTGPLTRSASFFAPPDGIYYASVGVFEYEPGVCASVDGYCLDDFQQFTNRIQIVGGQAYDAGPAPNPVALAVEYYHARFNHYFITTFSADMQALDSGRYEGWVRTGLSFYVWSSGPGLAGVCRFFSASFAPLSSHFYTPDANECAIVQQNPDWTYEAIAFYTQLPDTAGNCGSGTTPLYRLYNDGQGGAPNHRYTTSTAVRATMMAQGWIPEGSGIGVIACVPAP